MDSDLDRRFQELRQSVDTEIARARAEIIDALNAGIARMRAAASEAEWQQAVLECGRSVPDHEAAHRLIGTLAHLTAPRESPPAEIPRAPATAGSAAQRFARVKVAEIQLYHDDAMKSGRAAHNLYGALKPQIDDARAAYAQQFLQNGNGAADYLHLEFVRALANDDETLLGPEYPGPQA